MTSDLGGSSVLLNMQNVEPLYLKMTQMLNGWKYREIFNEWYNLTYLIL